ncbi:MAG: hypothetical protein K2X61_04435 [Caulobacteraceae bacterium]|nr:hypothetical protein [Caulobacteraceae bacterium]
MTPGTPKHRRLLLFATIVLLVQALFWFGVYQPLLSVQSAGELDRVTFSDIRLAELSAPTLEAAEAATHRTVTLPYTDCCDPVYLSLKLDFVLDEVPEQGLGLLAYQQVDNMILLVNGSVVAADGSMTIGRQTFQGQKGRVVLVPSGLLLTGVNTVSFITVRDGLPYTDLYTPILAPADQVKTWAARRLWQTNESILIGGWTTFILGLFAIVMAFRSQERAFATWLATLCFAWSGLAAYALVLDYPIGGIARIVAFFATNSLLSVALLGFVDAWTRRPLRWLQPGAAAVWLVFVAGTTACLAFVPMPQAYDIPGVAWSALTTFMGAAVVLRLILHFATADEDRRIEAGLLTIVAVCVVLDALGAYFNINEGKYVVDSAPVLLLALVVAFIQRNFTLFRSAMSLNQLLGERLAVREAELAQAHAREREAVRQQAHDEERRRIMRDMHDGLGSQLMGMLLAARRGKADPASVAEGLQSVIDEMRLMIDSMDSVGESLALALTTFQDRVRPRIEAAGFQMVWSIPPEISLPDYSPRTVLQIFRILQEAVTNALKHSGGTRIDIVVGADPDDDTVSLTIRDNGKGISEPGTSGHGLRNMTARANLIGGQLQIDSSRTGTGIDLLLPRYPKEA